MSRPPLPRLPLADTHALLNTLAAGRSDYALAKALGVAKQDVSRARSVGLTVEKARRWTERLSSRP